MSKRRQEYAPLCHRVCGGGWITPGQEILPEVFGTNPLSFPASFLGLRLLLERPAYTDRGGSWCSLPGSIRHGYCDDLRPDQHEDDQGLRLVLEVPYE